MNQQSMTQEVPYTKCFLIIKRIWWCNRSGVNTMGREKTWLKTCSRSCVQSRTTSSIRNGMLHWRSNSLEKLRMAFRMIIKIQTGLSWIKSSLSIILSDIQLCNSHQSKSRCVTKSSRTFTSKGNNGSRQTKCQIQDRRIRIEPIQPTQTC